MKDTGIREACTPELLTATLDIRLAGRYSQPAMPKRILVIEDERNVRAVIQKRLEASGYQVFTAADGLDGLELARMKKPDLIVLDLMLPKLDGNSVCRELRNDPDCSKIPILMLTGRTREKEIRQGIMEGANLYMTKPFRHEQLLESISELLLNAEREAAIRSAM